MIPYPDPPDEELSMIHHCDARPGAIPTGESHKACPAILETEQIPDWAAAILAEQWVIGRRKLAELSGVPLAAVERVSNGALTKMAIAEVELAKARATRAWQRGIDG